MLNKAKFARLAACCQIIRVPPGRFDFGLTLSDVGLREGIFITKVFGGAPGGLGMRGYVWAAFAAFVFLGCGTSTAPSPGGGTSGTTSSTAQHTLTVHIAGLGKVKIGTQTCTADCTQTFAAGTAVQLTAVPGSNWIFGSWKGACSGTGSCSITMNSDAAVTATFTKAPSSSGGQVTITVAIGGDGSGHVTSTPAGIDCPGTCSMQVATGTSISLTAKADSSSSFSGWSGACTGTGAGCSFTANASETISANFASTAPTVTHTLTVSVTGSGTITSTPAGISCPGTCSAKFNDGTQVSLTASSPVDWGGACSGSGDCSVTMSGDQSVSASFAPQECSGITPGSVGTPVTGTVDGSGQSGNQCANATSDGQGNVAGELTGASGNPWTVWTSGGNKSGNHMDGFFLVPQGAGFQGLGDSSSGDTFTVWGPDGSVVSAPGPSAADAMTHVKTFTAATGGSVLVMAECFPPPTGGMSLTVDRFDPAGNQLGQFKISGTGCSGPSNAGVADDQDHTLVVLDTGGSGALGFGAHRYIARWLDRGGNALTDWFDAGAVNAGSLIIRPLIGGGAALAEAGFQWFASIPSASATVNGPPSFAVNGSDLQITPGEKAYALIPVSGNSMELISPSGTSCGSLQIPDAKRLQLGLDGTVIDLNGSDGCSLRWWPALLK